MCPEKAPRAEADSMVGGANAWLIVDDTALPKKGEHSVGVAPQYASSLGKTANCQSLVSLTLTTLTLRRLTPSSPFRGRRQHWRKREILPSADGSSFGDRSIRIEARTKLLAAIVKGRRWLDEILSGSVAYIDAIAAREDVSERSARMTLSLAFLAPDIVKVAVNGTLPRGFGVSRPTNLPANRNQQRRVLGLARPS